MEARVECQIYRSTLSALLPLMHGLSLTWKLTVHAKLAPEMLSPYLPSAELET